MFREAFYDRGLGARVARDGHKRLRVAQLKFLRPIVGIRGEAQAPVVGGAISRRRPTQRPVRVRLLAIEASAHVRSEYPEIPRILLGAWFSAPPSGENVI